MKPQLDFLDSAKIPWTPIPQTTAGFKGAGVSQKILSIDPDNPDYCTRLLKIEAGYKATQTLSHSFWEEIYVIQGTVVNDETGEIYKPGFYCCRRPGMLHGPSHTDTGALLFECRYQQKE